MKSRILKEVHETAKDLAAAGLMDKQTMREFDALCLPRVKQYSKEEIRKIRERQQTSQAVFAAYLNTTAATIRSWEQGSKKPSGAALKLLEIIDRKGLDILS